MTFQEQQRLCLVTAGAGALAALAAIALLRSLGSAGDTRPSLEAALEWVSGGGQFICFLSLFVSGVRGFHRWTWLNIVKPPQVAMLDWRIEMSLEGGMRPVGRWWMWLDEAGNDRDARR